MAGERGAEAKEHEGVVKKIVQGSYGQVERCVVASEDGLPIASYGNPEEVNEIIAAIAAPLFAATQDVIKNLEDTKVLRIDVELANSKHLIIVPKAMNIVAVLSRPCPNLGLVYYLLEEVAEPTPDEEGGE